MSILSERAMLSVLNLSSWTAKKTDKKVTRDVLEQHNARPDAGKWNKQLVSKEALAEINLIHSRARDYHRLHTLPWLDKGPRLLPAKFHAEYEQEMREHQENAEQAYGRFVAGYPDFVADAQVTQNGMFNAADYPRADRIARKFGFSLNLLPVPDDRDFRVDISEAVAERIRASVRASNEAVAQAATAELMGRAHELLTELVDALRKYQPATADHGVIGTFRDSKLENIADLVAMLPGLNIMDDPQIDRLRDDLRGLLHHGPKNLREDSKARHAVADEAQSIMDHVSSFMD